MKRKDLGLELRKHRGKKLRSDFIADMSRRLDLPESEIELVDLETSERFLAERRETWKAYGREYESYFRKSWYENEVENVSRDLEEIRTVINDRPMYLYRQLSEFCGAVRIGLHKILTRAFSLVELDGEDVLAISEDDDYSMLFDYFEEYMEPGSPKKYELVLRGDWWSDESP